MTASPPFLTSPAFAGAPNVRAAFFGRQGGVSTGLYESLNCGPGSRDDADAVAENRRRAALAAGLTGPERLVTLHQVHSAHAVTVAAPFDGPRPEADALATSTPGLGLGVLTADCAPVLLADAEAQVIGAAHAGWRGAFTGVLEAVLDAMERLGADRSRVRAAVGPCISQDAYEVGPEFVARFTEAAPSSAALFAPGADDRSQFDLKAYVARRLRAAGAAEVDVAAACTFSQADAYFSHRRGVKQGAADYGRNLSVIFLAP